MATSAEPNVTCSENEERQCRGFHRFRILNFAPRVNGVPAEAVKSADFSVGDHTWRLECHPAGVRPEVSDYVSLFVRYLGPQERVTAHWELRCVNHKEGGSHKERRWTKNDTHNIFKKQNRWGWDKFMRKDAVLQAGAGFLSADGHVTFEAGITLASTNWTYDPRRVQERPARASVAADLLRLLRSGDLSDAVFVCDGGETRLRAHRQILAARSQVFAAMFSGQYAENRPSSEKGCIEVDIVDVEGATLAELLHFLYAGKLSLDLCKFLPESDAAPGEPRLKKRRRDEAELVNLSAATRDCLATIDDAAARPETLDDVTTEQMAERFQHLRFVLGLVQAADKYQVTELREECEEFLCALVDKHSVVDLVVLADTFNAAVLKQQCLRFMQQNKPVTLFRSQIARLSKELLVEIMQMTTAEVDGADAFSPGARSLNHVFVSCYMEFSSPDFPQLAAAFADRDVRLRLRLFGVDAPVADALPRLRDRLMDAVLGAQTVGTAPAALANDDDDDDAAAPAHPETDAQRVGKREVRRARRTSGVRAKGGKRGSPCEDGPQDSA